MNNELISVIIPVYNVEEYLEKCVNSVINQSYNNLEIILVDDGSKDSSGKMCDDLSKRDDRIVVLHKKNGGLSSARNYGIDRMHGKYVTFVDSDDFIDKYMIESLYNALTKNDLDITICNGIDYKDFGYYGSNEKNNEEQVRVYDKKEAMLMSNTTLFIVAYQKLYKSIIFKKLRYADGLIHEDAQIAPYIYDNVNKVGVIRDVLYYRFIRENSIVHSTFSQKNYDVVKVAEDRLDFYKQNKYEYLYNQGYTFLLGSYVILYKKAFSSKVDKKTLNNIMKEYKNKYNELKNVLTTYQRIKYGFFYVFPNICVSMLK